MFSLYNQILGSCPVDKCLTIDELIISSGFAYTVRQRLLAEGYNTSQLSDRQCALLFALLNDIVYISTRTDFYMATMNTNSISELHTLGNLAPCDEGGYEKVVALLDNLSKESINKFLGTGKFKVIKLLPLDIPAKTPFITQVGGMRSYPTLEKESVYTLQCLFKWTKIVINTVKYDFCNIETTNGNVYLKGSDVVASPAFGYINFCDSDDNLVSLRIWDVKKVEVIKDNDFIRGLYNGVVKYKDMYLTLNYNVLERFYGAKILYQQLESKGVRQRLCLREISPLSPALQLASCKGYIEKYALDNTCSTVKELVAELRKVVYSTEVEAKRLVHPRVLRPVNQVIKGFKSFYTTINLEHLDKYEVIENYEFLMPQSYIYSAISPQFGYRSVMVESFTEESAKKAGAKEFNRQFGEEGVFCSLTCNYTRLAVGYKQISIALDTQIELAEMLQCGYTKCYDDYVKLLRCIAYQCNYKEFVEDDFIKYVFINRLAKRVPKAENLTLLDVSLAIVQFTDILLRGSAAKELYKEYLALADGKARRQWVRLKALEPNYEGCQITDSESGLQIITEYAIFKLNKDMTLSKHIHLKYRGKDLGNILIK